MILLIRTRSETCTFVGGCTNKNKMNSVPINNLTPEAQRLLEQSSASPKMYAFIKGYETDPATQAIKYQIEVGVKSSSEKVNIKTISKRYSELEELDKNVRKYFKGQKILETFPPKKVFGNTDKEFLIQRKTALQTYITQLLKVPGICIFPFFLSVFELDVELFIQQE